MDARHDCRGDKDNEGAVWVVVLLVLLLLTPLSRKYSLALLLLLCSTVVVFDFVDWDATAAATARE
jgi:hypothetical protein